MVCGRVYHSIPCAGSGRTIFSPSSTHASSPWIEAEAFSVGLSLRTVSKPVPWRNRKRVKTHGVALFVWLGRLRPSTQVAVQRRGTLGMARWVEADQKHPKGPKGDVFRVRRRPCITTFSHQRVVQAFTNITLIDLRGLGGRDADLRALPQLADPPFRRTVLDLASHRPGASALRGRDAWRPRRALWRDWVIHLGVPPG